jgi:transposase-like protein
MNIVERGRAFLRGLRDLATRTAWEWRRCPHCGKDQTCKHGSYTRQPWFLSGRQTVRVQRHRCQPCRRTYSEQSALLVRGGWYAREVRRCAIDHWQHGGSSLRRTAEWLRSWLGRQERWQLWRPLDGTTGERCYLAPSTIQWWLDGAGRAAQTTIPDQLVGATLSGQMGTDGLWARLRGSGRAVVLLLVDQASGLLFPPVVAASEASAAVWQRLFTRASRAGLDRDVLRGITSDGARGLGAYLAQALAWVNHQRCVWHLWRSLGGEIAAQGQAAAADLSGAAAQALRRTTRRELSALIRAVLDAPTRPAAHDALATLRAHAHGATLATLLDAHLESALVHLRRYNHGLCRIAPEWCWRDFRLRLSHGRNHGSGRRLARAALLWALYRNFTPAQERSERKRIYPRSGTCALEMAGVPPNEVCYLDALGI